MTGVTLIKAVCFDMGGVLTHPIGPVFMDRALAAGVDPHDVMGTFRSFSSADDGDEPAHQLERGEITVEEFFEALGPVAPSVWHLMHPDSPNFVPNGFVRHDGMHDFLREVKASGLKTGLITNSVYEWKPKWDELIPDHDLFDTIVHSCEVGLRKPGLEIFELTCRRLGVEPGEVLFLDDFPANADAARRAGMVVVDVADHDVAIAEARRLLGWQPLS